MTNLESIDYLNGLGITTTINWLPENHKTSTFKYNITKGLQAKFVALAPYKEHWDTVSRLDSSNNQ